MEFNPAQKQQYRAFKALYRTAFPACERQPFWFLLRQQKRGASRLYAATDESGNFLGLAVLVPREGIVMINYLAVAESARGSGVGGQILAAIRALYPYHRIVLEIETPDPASPDYSLRARRETFYLRSGYTRTGVRLHIGGNDMTLLSLGGHVSYEEYCKIQKHALGPFIWKRLHVHPL